MYAREDTHYLMYIYDLMKNELLERGNQHNNLLQAVLTRSHQICAKVRWAVSRPQYVWGSMCMCMCGVVWCGVVWCGVVWCGVVCGVVWCGVCMCCK